MLEIIFLEAMGDKALSVQTLYCLLVTAPDVPRHILQQHMAWEVLWFSLPTGTASIIMPNHGIQSPWVPSRLTVLSPRISLWSHKYLCWIEPSLSQQHDPAGHTGSAEIHPLLLPLIYPSPVSRCKSPLSLCRHLQRRKKNEVYASA